MRDFMIFAILFAIGGGTTSINATELSTICTNNNSYCEIKSSKPLITNHTIFTANSTSSNYMMAFTLKPLLIYL